MHRLTGYRVPSQSEHDKIMGTIYKLFKRKVKFCTVMSIAFFVPALTCLEVGIIAKELSAGITLAIVLGLISLVFYLIDRSTNTDKILARHIKARKYLILDCTVADFKQVNYSKGYMVGTRRYITIKDRNGREAQKLFKVDAQLFADLHNEPDTPLTVLTDEEQHCLIRI